MTPVGKWKIATYLLSATTVGALWYGRAEPGVPAAPKAASHDAAYTSRLAGLARLRIPAGIAGFDEDQLLSDLKGARSRQEIRLLCERLGIFGSDRSLSTLEDLRRARPDVAGDAIMAMGGIGSEAATDRLITLAQTSRSGPVYWAVRGLAKTGRARAHEQLYTWALDAPRTLRLAAIDSLSEVRSDEAVETLVLVAEDADTEVLQRVVGAAGGMATPEAIELMLEVADRGNRQVRMTALSSMPRTLNSQQQDWLMNVLVETDMHCAGLAAEALGRAQATDALPLLADAAKSTSRELRLGAIRGLAAMGGKKAKAAVIKLFATARASEAYELGRALLDSGGDAGRKAILAAVKNGHPARRELVGLLHDLSGSDVDALRLDILKNGTPRERQSVVGQLVGSNNPEVATIMMGLARNGANQDRYAALNFLSRSSSDESKQAMLDIASGGGQASVEALRMLGERRATEPAVEALLLEALDSGAPNKVQSATWALANSGSLVGREALLEALSSNNPTLANAALGAIGQLGQGPEVLDALQSVAQNSDNPQLKSSALYQLANSDDPAATELVVEAIERGDQMAGSMVASLLQRGGPDAERAIEVSLASDSPTARASLASALGGQGGAQAESVLATLVEDEDATVKSSAIYALGNLGSKEAGERLVALATGGDTATQQAAISALANSGDARAGRVIADAITSGDPELAQTALHSAHNIGPEADVALQTLADDESAALHLRQQAASTLINRGGVAKSRYEEMRALSMPQSGVFEGFHGTSF